MQGRVARHPQAIPPRTKPPCRECGNVCISVLLHELKIMGLGIGTFPFPFAPPVGALLRRLNALACAVHTSARGRRATRGVLSPAAPLATAAVTRHVRIALCSRSPTARVRLSIHAGVHMRGAPWRLYRHGRALRFCSRVSKHRPHTFVFFPRALRTVLTADMSAERMH